MGRRVEADSAPAVCKKFLRVWLTRWFQSEVGMAEEIYPGAAWFVKRPNARRDVVKPECIGARITSEASEISEKIL